MKKKQFSHLKTNYQNKIEFNQSRVQNNSSILLTQNSLSKIIKTEEDSLFKSNRNHSQITDQEMQDIEKKLALSTNGSFNLPKNEEVVYIRENIISNRDIKLPKKIIFNNIDLDLKKKTQDTTTEFKQFENTIPSSHRELKPSYILSSTDKKVLVICFVVLSILAAFALVFVFFKVLKSN